MIEFLNDNSIYLVFLITLIIWLGLAFYMINIDRKLSNLEKKIIDEEKRKKE
jgi:CcmD family protein